MWCITSTGGTALSEVILAREVEKIPCGHCARAMFVGVLGRTRLHGCPDPFQSLKIHRVLCSGVVMGPSRVCWGVGDENWGRMSCAFMEVEHRKRFLS